MPHIGLHCQVDAITKNQYELQLSLQQTFKNKKKTGIAAHQVYWLTHVVLKPGVDQVVGHIISATRHKSKTKGFLHTNHGHDQQGSQTKYIIMVRIERQEREPRNFKHKLWARRLVQTARGN